MEADTYRASVPEAGCRPKGGVPREFHGRIAVPDSSDRVLGHYAGFAQFTVADNGTLLYRRGGGDSGALALAWVDRQGQVEPLAAERRPYGGLRISPDGQRVAVGVFEGGNGDVIVYDLARDTPTRLTFDPARDDFPLWTQDGERVVFASARDGGPLSVYSKAADGTAVDGTFVSVEVVDSPSALAIVTAR